MSNGKGGKGGALVVAGLGVLLLWGLSQQEDNGDDNGDDGDNGGGNGKKPELRVSQFRLRAFALGSRGEDQVGAGETLIIDDTVNTVGIVVEGQIKNAGKAPAALDGSFELAEHLGVFRVWFAWEPGQGVQEDYPRSKGLITGYPYTYPAQILGAGDTFALSQGLVMSGPASNNTSRAFWQNEGHDGFNFRADLVEVDKKGNSRIFAERQWTFNAGTGVAIRYSETPLAQQGGQVLGLGQCPQCAGPAVVVSKRGRSRPTGRMVGAMAGTDLHSLGLRRDRPTQRNISRLLR
jgi:hypothetical protein